MSQQPSSIPTQDRVRLMHMRDAARRAIEIAGSKDVAALSPDSETALALTRLVEIIGEAARYVSDETKAKHPEVLWRQMSGMRNRIVHKYFDVDFSIVAAVIRDDLPVLLEQIDEIL